MVHPDYRPDIDGLRSLAVIPVVFFHLGLTWMPGGFVGVDVFFVISGFLITRIIAREIGSGSFSILDFYVRRIHRILPALLVMIAVTLAITSAFFAPIDLYNAAQSAAAAVLFSGNILFYLEAGYFDAASYQKPLLHTWSLGIEEQFYIFLPLLLMLLARLRWRMDIFVAVLTAVSLALSVTTTVSQPTAAYYLLPWRAWELGLGALLALGFLPAWRSRLVREAAACCGLLLILGSALVITRQTAFPGWAALAPTIGAALIIHAGSAGESRVGQLLSTAPAVWIGRLSYSLYLWHWPVIVVFVYLRMAFPDAAEATGLFALSLALSWLSWRYVEQPFRNPAAARGRRTVFVTAGVAMAAVIAGAGVLVVTKGFPGRLPADAQRIAAFSLDYPDRMPECFWDVIDEKSWSEPCHFGDGQVPAEIAVWGDSHAPALMPALDGAAKDIGLSVALYANGGCPPIRNFQVYWVGQEHDCLDFVTQSYQSILANPNLKLLVIMVRPAIYTQGWTPYGLAERDRTDLLIGDKSAPLSSEADRTGYFLEGMEQTIRSFQGTGTKIALVYPLPEAGFSVPDSIVRNAILGAEPADVSLPRTLYDGRTSDVIAAYDRLVEAYDLLPVRLDQMLCDDDSCSLTLDGDPLYRDSNHLNKTSAQRLAPQFAAALRLARQEKHVEN